MTECPTCDDEQAPHETDQGTIECRRCGREWDPETGDVITEGYEPAFEKSGGDTVDAAVFASGFLSTNYLDAARANPLVQQFVAELERAIVTFDTSRYEALEVLLPAHRVGPLDVAGQPALRAVEQGDPSAEELVERRILPPLAHVERYDADQIDAMRTYAHDALDRDELQPLERFVERRLAVNDDDVTLVAKRIARAVREHGDVDDFVDFDS